MDAGSGHITNLKQSILETFNIYGLVRVKLWYNLPLILFNFVRQLTKQQKDLKFVDNQWQSHKTFLDVNLSDLASYFNMPKS